MARASTTSDPFNAIAEPRRRHILEFIGGDERSVTDIVDALELGQPSVYGSDGGRESVRRGWCACVNGGFGRRPAAFGQPNF